MCCSTVLVERTVHPRGWCWSFNAANSSPGATRAHSMYLCSRFINKLCRRRAVAAATSGTRLASAEADSEASRSRLPRMASSGPLDIRTDGVGAAALQAALQAAVPVKPPSSASGSSLLTLPPGVKWPQLGAAPLFVRPWYEDCFEGPLERLKPGGKFILMVSARGVRRCCAVTQ